MNRLLALGGLLLVVSSAKAAKAPTKPPEVIEKGIFPFAQEGDCAPRYGSWTSWGDLVLVNAPHGKKVVGEIREGTVARAVTGEIHNQPVPVEVVVSTGRYKVGGRYWYVSPQFGEGKRYLWANGQRLTLPKRTTVLTSNAGPGCLASPRDCWARFLEPPRYEWWVQFSLPGRKRGWAQVDRPAQQFQMESESCEDE